MAHHAATAATASETAAPDVTSRIRAALDDLAHLLPAQAPLRDFVHHNTLHAFQQQSFADACSEASRLTGASAWLDETRCRDLLRQGRVNAGDLDAALLALVAARAAEPVCRVGGRELRRGEVLQAVLRHAPGPSTRTQLRWQIEEEAALLRWQSDLTTQARRRLLAAAHAAGFDEAAAVADLWAAALQLQPSPLTPPDTAARVDSRPALPGWPAVVGGPATPAATAALWCALTDGLGSRWTLLEMLAHLSGEDEREALHATLIRQLGAHLDQGLAGWHNPARARGFYGAWRDAAAGDWAWLLDDFVGARQAMKELPAEPLPAIIAQLQALGIDEANWGAYLQRLALELPGWAGMCQWRQAHPESGRATVTLADFLAVRLLLERLHAARLTQRIWGSPMSVAELGSHFAASAGELLLRHAFGCRQVNETMLDAMTPRLAPISADAAGDWAALATRLAGGDDQLPVTDPSRPADEHEALATWPLFLLAQRLGLSGGDLREIGPQGGQALLDCADSLTRDQRGEVWLLAYERNYRQQILAALTANHGRAAPLAGNAEAQFVFCMDDREEGSRRHLEELNPAFETFGAAGFFAVPMLWQGLDDETATALCPIVVRPTNALREAVPSGAEQAQRRHQRRRQWRLDWRERLHQGSRRGWLQAALLNALAAPLGLLSLIARALAPGRFGRLLAECRDAFDQPVAGTLPLTADGDEASRVASAEQPRQGFSEEEQLARVGGFLRSIGLTRHFAPLVVIVGHGSDSRNNPHLAAYDCGACSGRHGGANARVFAALANRPQVRAGLAEQGLQIPDGTWFVGAEHNTCDESYLWYDLEHMPASQRPAFARLRHDCARAAGLHAVERCRRFASAPRDPSPAEALAHLADRRQDIGQARPELGHATVAAAFVGRRTMSRRAFFDRRVFLISYDPLPDSDGRILEATLLAAGPVGAGINLEYYFSTVDNEGFGCGSKVMHNLAGLFGVMQGTRSDLRTGLPRQMIEIHEPMRLLVVVEQTLELLSAIYQRQPPLQELIGNGWVVLAAKHPESGAIHLFDPTLGWQPWPDDATGDDRPDAGEPATPIAEVDRSRDHFADHSEALPPALLRQPPPTA